MKNVQKLILMALFLSIGTILDAVVPSFYMKPDMLLSTMFLSLFLFADKKNIILLGLVAGILSGLTTSFPNGFIPNVIDKLVTSGVIYLIFISLGKVRHTVISSGILTAVGTLLSGTIFLTAAMIIAQLPPNTSFSILFVAVVIPATVINTVAVVILYPIVKSIAKRTRLSVQHS